jgi:nitrile hydratase subunit beta
MNGIHDMGGMHGFGPINREANEPVFHERWEARAQALHTAMAAWRKWDTDHFRSKLESMPGSEYFRMSYYERRFLAFTKLLIEAGFVSEAELDGHTKVGETKAVPALDTAGVARVFSPRPSHNKTESPCRFQIADAVRARVINPTHHTRLPRYARGKTGVIEMTHGEWIFPDANVLGLGKIKQHLYTVRFPACELWGDGANPRDTVCVELWDDYLDAA